MEITTALSTKVENESDFLVDAMVLAYKIIGAAALCAACAIGGYLHGVDVTEHSQLKQQAIVAEAAQAVRTATAEEIAKIKIVNRTVNQKVIRETTSNPVYIDCRVPASGVQHANEAIAGLLATDSELPKAAND